MSVSDIGVKLSEVIFVNSPFFKRRIIHFIEMSDDKIETTIFNRYKKQ